MSNVNEEAAALVVERYRHARFEWGMIDCLHFAADFVDARLGTDYLTRIHAALPTYRTAIEAIRIINSQAPGTDPLTAWEALITKFVGPPSPVTEVVFGDVVLGYDLYPNERCLLLGICDDDMFMAPGGMGLVWIDINKAVRVWKCLKR